MRQTPLGILQTITEAVALAACASAEVKGHVAIRDLAVC
jgi:hypothetical protein